MQQLALGTQLAQAAIQKKRDADSLLEVEQARVDAEMKALSLIKEKLDTEQRRADSAQKLLAMTAEKLEREKQAQAEAEAKLKA